MEPSAASPHAPPAPRAFAAALGLVCAAALGAIWAPAIPPGMDAPIHMLTADVLASPEAYAGRYTPHLARTSQGFVWLMVPFMGLGAVAAFKIAQTLLVAAYAAALGRAAVLAAPPGKGARAPGALLGVTLALGLVHALGFMNFALAMPACFLAVGYAMRALREPRAWRYVGAWLLIASALHIIVGAFAIAQIGGIALVASAATSRDRLRRVALAVGVALPAAAYVVAVGLYARTAAGWDAVAEDLGTTRLPLAEQVGHLLDGPWGGFSGLGGLLVALTLLFAARSAAGGRTERRRILLCTAAFWVGAYALLPWHAQGWAYAQPRVLVMGFGVAALFGAWGDKAGRLLFVTTLFSLAYLISWGDSAHRAGRQVAAVVSGFGDADAGTTTIATLAAPPVPASRHVTPWLHAGAHAIRQGARNDDRYRFNPAIHSARPAPLPRELGPPLPQFIFHALDAEGEARDARVADVVDRIAERARRWDSVVVVGVAEDMLAPFEARGLRAVEGSAPIGDAPGAIVALTPAQLRVTLAPRGDAPLTVRLGYPDTIGWFDGRGGPAPAGELDLVFDALPAGPLRVELLEGDRLAIGVDVTLEPGAEARLRLAPGEIEPPR